MANKKLEISLFCEIYGVLLSERQKEILEMHCNEDYSLSEIAENTGITRQGVRENIKNAEKQLEIYEEKLGLLEKFRFISERVNLIANHSIVKLDEELLRLTNEILEQINFD